MKACPACGRLFPDDAGFCPVDGQGLRSATQVPPQASDDARVGTTVAQRYEIRRVVADGGMGRVYEALDLLAKRRVAVKILHDQVARDEVAVERFKREFEVSKELPHDHIVDVLDFRQEGGTYALVMEFLDGEELRTVLKRERTLTPGRLVRMVSQLALGLGPAHARGFIHRDLKPDNVFLVGERDGDVVKLLDFGSVKDKSEKAKKLTVLGTTIGSPYYMAPEQAQGLDTLDQRADVWAIAAMAYESLTGTVPFLGSNGPMILLSILTKEPTPPSAAGEKAAVRVPSSLDAVFAAAFVKNPAGRILTALELAKRMGTAYGLRGDVEAWAKSPQHVLDEAIQAELPALLAQVAPAVIADPFAGFHQTTRGTEVRFDLSESPPSSSSLSAVVPKAAPRWVAPVLVLAVVLLVLGVVAALLAR